MRLTIIGSSPAWPNPGGAHSGYLVDADGSGRLLLDCGPGVLSRLRRDRMLPVDAIAITHFHLDHWGDLVPWCWLAASGLEPPSRPQLWIPPGGAEILGEFAQRFGQPSMFEDAFEVAEYSPGESFETAGLWIEPWPVEHYDLPAFGFRVRDVSRRVLAFSGDTAPCDGLRRLADGADLFLCEATLEAGSLDNTPRGHLSAEEALEAATGRTLLTHRPSELAAPDGAERAEDGLSVEI
jgi:ribonuclease BN (tRNA processing enzyme)